MRRRLHARFQSGRRSIFLLSGALSGGTARVTRTSHSYLRRALNHRCVVEEPNTPDNGQYSDCNKSAEHRQGNEQMPHLDRGQEAGPNSDRKQQQQRAEVRCAERALDLSLRARFPRRARGTSANSPGAAFIGSDPSKGWYITRRCIAPRISPALAGGQIRQNPDTRLYDVGHPLADTPRSFATTSPKRPCGDLIQNRTILGRVHSETDKWLCGRLPDRLPCLGPSTNRSESVCRMTEDARCSVDISHWLVTLAAFKDNRIAAEIYPL